MSQCQYEGVPDNRWTEGTWGLGSHRCKKTAVDEGLCSVHLRMKREREARIEREKDALIEAATLDLAIERLRVLGLDVTREGTKLRFASASDLLDLLSRVR